MHLLINLHEHILYSQEPNILKQELDYLQYGKIFKMEKC